MNWNNNDLKYILKRVIVYFVIASILFFAGQRCAKASVLSAQVSSDTTFISIGQTGLSNIDIYSGNIFASAGEGELIGSFMFYTFNSNAPYLIGVRVSTEQSIYQCDIGNQMFYNDNNKQYILVTYRCPMNIQNNNHLKKITIQGGWTTGDYLRTSSYLTYVTKGDNGSQSIIDANQNAFNNVISNIASGNATAHQDAQNIINSVNTSTQQEVAAIQAQTQAINNVTDTINAGYNSNTGTDYLDVFDNIFTQEDENVIRQFVMIPFNLYILLYNAITSGSCQSISLGALYGVNLDLPCINLRQIIGVPLYTAIDTIFGACLLFGIVRMIKKFFNSLFSLSSKATDECGIEVFK